MKAKIFTFLICVVVTFFSYSQSNNIADIDKLTKDIKANLNSYQKVIKTNTSDGLRLVYFKDKTLKLITVKAIELDKEKYVEWFYDNGQLIYSDTNWLDKKTQKITFTEKCYLNNGQLISWINQNKTIDNSSDEFKKMSVDLAVYGSKIKDDAFK